MKIIFLLLLACSRALGGELSPAEAAKLEQDFFQQQKSNRTLSGRFTQTISARGLSQDVASRGKLYFRAPDTLRIAFEEPAGDVQQIDARHFTTLRPDAAPQQLTPTHPSAAALAALRDILHGIRPETPMQSTVMPTGDHYEVVLTPLQPSNRQPQKITLVIHTRTLQLKSFTIFLPRGVQMNFQLTDLKRNTPLPADIFQLP